jgi:CRISPR-associated protein Csm1
MLDENIMKIAFVAFMHDIGKFAKFGMSVSDEYLNKNKDLYQPYNEQFKTHTHRHVVYTAAFIDHIEKWLPKAFDKINWGLDDTLINLVSSHHKPITPMQWIIAMADRISSGWDRNGFDEYNKAITPDDSCKIRLMPIFETLLCDNDTRHNYRYPLKEIAPQHIFPVSVDTCPKSDKEATAEYKNLFDDFVFNLEHLKHREDDINLWFDHLDSLMMIYTANIPYASADKVVPDVSLYDHSSTTSAIASALYIFHHATNTMDVSTIQDYDQQKFMVIMGDFYGIQNFIFSDGGETKKLRSKILRGRSFAVTLISELAAALLCREIGIPSTSVVLNAAGKFIILAPNIETTRNAIVKAQTEINDWLIRLSCGEWSLGMSFIPASPEDFVNGAYGSLIDKLNRCAAQKKLRKIPLDWLGVVDGYLDGFKNDLARPLCPFCGKRPSVPEAEGTFDGKITSACALCRDHIYLGTKLVKENRIAVTAINADIHDPANKLLEPIFGKFQITFGTNGLKDMARSGKLIKYWDISLDEEGKVAKDVSIRFINGYVPVYSEVDKFDNRLLEGNISEEKKIELIEMVREGGIPKTFTHIACKALNLQQNGVYTGIQALGVLKADVDQLGLLISCGIKEHKFNISRMASLSRQMNNFFCLYLPHLLKTDERFKDVYTVFAGGDDLFLIGPWNQAIILASVINERFAAYTCSNREIHLSAGITLTKPHVPLDRIAEQAEMVLYAAKEAGRNRITVFGETVTWEKFRKLTEIRDVLKDWSIKGLTNPAMLYRINTFIAMAAKEKLVMNGDKVNIKDMECLKWRALFRYSTERNIGRGKPSAERKGMVQEFIRVAKWLEDHGGALKIALWDIIYNQR